jgi:hypothetical protein
LGLELHTYPEVIASSQKQALFSLLRLNMPRLLEDAVGGQRRRHLFVFHGNCRI